MRINRAGTALSKVLVAIASAVFATFLVGMFFGIPRDVDTLEKRIQAFEQASYRDGRAVSDEDRDKALSDAGHSFHLPASSSPTPQVAPRSGWSVLEDAVRWYPRLFCILLTVFLLLFRPGVYAGLIAALVLAPLAVVLSAGVSISVAVACLLYAAVETARGRPGTSKSTASS